VRADPDRIQQVVWNLLSNAVKFTNERGRVSVRLTRVGHHLQIEVADNGRGIDPKFLPHVFERFRQEDASTTRVLGGLGLGLSIAKQLVELHGGTIRADSAGEGKGSTFTAQLPLSEMATVSLHVGQAPTMGDATPGSAFSVAEARASVVSPMLAGLRILVVEDEPSTRSAIQTLLEAHQAQVTAVDSAALAVAAFRERLATDRYQVLVCDLGLPIQDGYELIREIRDLERQRGEQQSTPAVALTAYAREDDRARSLAAGFQLHVAKPIEPQPLVEALAKISAGNARHT